MIFTKKPKPNEIFTPRSNELNVKTYAERPNLESRLKKALNGHKYIILHGESGNGKTWLYKRVLEQSNTPFEVINLARMHTEGSLNAVLALKLGELGYKNQVSETQEVDGGVKPGGVGVNYKHTFTYAGQAVGTLEALGMTMAKIYKNKKSVIVLDNFEQIIDDKQFVREVTSLIISADEDFIAKCPVKFLVVGTPTNIKQMMSSVSNANTIANRFVEIPEVARLELGESRYVMSQGFERHLDLTILLDKNDLYKNISFKTDRIAQHVQEYCLKIAENATANNSVINLAVVHEAEKEWLDETLSTDISSVMNLMNSQETKVGRKNQVMYCLGRVTKEDFKTSEIEKMVRDIFDVPNTINLNIPQIISEFQKSNNPIVKKSTRLNHFSFCSPKIRIVIRSMLFVDQSGRVQVK